MNGQNTRLHGGPGNTPATTDELAFAVTEETLDAVERKMRAFLWPQLRNHADLDDVTQAVFLAGAEYLARHGNYPSIAYFYRVARNQVASHFRRNRRRRIERDVVVDEIAEEPTDESPIKDDNVKLQLLAEVGKHIECRMKPGGRSQKIMQMRVDNPDLTPAEIAERLGTTPKVVYETQSKQYRQIRERSPLDRIANATDDAIRKAK